MSGERAPFPVGGSGLLRGSRTRSYGSLVRSQLSPVQRRHVEHRIQPGETLQGLAVKYGVSMELIKRANLLYTNDSIFLKKSLSIPVMSDLDDDITAADLAAEVGGTSGSTRNGDTAEPSQGSRERMSDLSPKDFLRRLDDLISQTKQAAARGNQDAEKRVADLEAACSSGVSGWRPLTRSQSVTPSSRTQQPAVAAHAGAVPLTVTKLTRKLREQEDEIFQL